MLRTFEERLNLVSQVNQGISIKELSRAYSLHETKILEWVRKYTLDGEAGLRKCPNIRATGEIKEELVRLVLEKGVPLGHIVVERGVSRTALEGWVRKTRQHGYSVLYETKKRGRPPKEMSRPKKKVPQTELERLQAENLRLRAENALLKKVKALVEEKEARARQNGQKPSTN